MPEKGGSVIFTSKGKAERYLSRVIAVDLERLQVNPAFAIS